MIADLAQNTMRLEAELTTANERIRELEGGLATCACEHAKELTAEREVSDKLVDALKEARRAIGDHYAPDHCYATGPLTGNEYRDLIECPACSAIAMHDAALAEVAAIRKQEEA